VYSILAPQYPPFITTQRINLAELVLRDSLKFVPLLPPSLGSFLVWFISVPNLGTAASIATHSRRSPLPEMMLLNTYPWVDRGGSEDEDFQQISMVDFFSCDLSLLYALLVCDTAGKFPRYIAISGVVGPFSPFFFGCRFALAQERCGTSIYLPNTPSTRTLCTTFSISSFPLFGPPFK